ncbi:hypothetical protein CDAR_265261 [Caerostris darwini]|uniref:Uncharacterized protein n=1 Tax=Caerostris darwini TaxID=1538125 RepID=A0AAV4W400_9ARAC|nr:hypothetical protein CDAR_265261 [Caerostris darwini]
MGINQENSVQKKLGKPQSRPREDKSGEPISDQQNLSPDQEKINHENFSQDIRLSIQDIISLSSLKAVNFRSSDSSSSFQFIKSKATSSKECWFQKFNEAFQVVKKTKAK